MVQHSVTIGILNRSRLYRIVPLQFRPLVPRQTHKAMDDHLRVFVLLLILRLQVHQEADVEPWADEVWGIRRQLSDEDPAHDHTRDGQGVGQVHVRLHLHVTRPVSGGIDIDGVETAGKGLVIL